MMDHILKQLLGLQIAIECCQCRTAVLHVGQPFSFHLIWVTMAGVISTKMLIFQTSLCRDYFCYPYDFIDNP